MIYCPNGEWKNLLSGTTNNGQPVTINQSEQHNLSSFFGIGKSGELS